MFNELFTKGGLSLDRLRAFCGVADAGGVTKAAGGRSTRQSQFSRQIKELEAFFGVELTQRRGKGIALSSAGLRLARIARGFFTTLEDFHRECKNEPKEFSIGAGDALLQWLLFPRLAELHDSFPSVVFRVLSLPTMDISERVSDFRLDFGLLRKDAISPLHNCEPLGTQTYSLFVPLKLIPDKKKPGWRQVISDIPLATIAGDGVFRASLEKAATKEKLKLRLALSCSSFPQVAKALQSERYAAILPTIASAELDRERFTVVPAPFLASQAREVCLIWNTRIADLRPMSMEVRERLTKLFRLSRAR